MAIPCVASVLALAGQVLAVNGPEALAEFIRMEIAKWTQIFVHIREASTDLE